MYTYITLLYPSYNPTIIVRLKRTTLYNYIPITIRTGIKFSSLRIPNVRNLCDLKNILFDYPKLHTRRPFET